MAKNEYRNFIQSHRTIKVLLRRLYLYGCYSRDDFKELFSGRKYDNELRRITYCIDGRFISKNVINKSKYWGFKHDMFKVSENFLVDSYYMKSFKGSDMSYFFLVQQILNSAGQKDAGLSLDEIANELSQIMNNGDVDSNTLRRKLKELESLGIISSAKLKNEYIYKISADFFEEFTSEEIASIFYAVQFYCNVGLQGVPGYFLKRTIKNYLRCERNEDFKEAQPYLFRHFNLSRLIDDDAIQCAINCIKEDKEMEIKYFKKKKSNWVSVIPLKIITEYYYGRQYLFCLDSNSDKVSLYRVDKIDEFKESKEIEKQIERTQYDKYINDSWCSTLLNEDSGLIEVEIDFKFDETKESYVLERIRREGQWGSLANIKEGHYLYRIKVTDPNELKPWIRSFHYYAKVRSSEHHQLSESIINDWEEALKNYGAVQ